MKKRNDSSSQRLRKKSTRGQQTLKLRKRDFSYLRKMAEQAGIDNPDGIPERVLRAAMGF
jgi:hypothetical protein